MLQELSGVSTQFGLASAVPSGQIRQAMWKLASFGAGISLGTLSAAALSQPPADQLAISSSIYIQGSIFNALPVPVNAYTSLLPNVQAAVSAASQVQSDLFATMPFVQN